MSEFFDELITGLNEAVAIERGELNGRKIVYESQTVETNDNNQIRAIHNSIGENTGGKYPPI